MNQHLLRDIKRLLSVYRTRRRPSSRVRRVSALVAFIMASLPAAVVSGTGLVAAATPTYTVTDLGTLGGTYTVANGINDNGQVVGTSMTATGAEDPFLWQNGTMTDLGSRGGIDTEGTAVSGTGLVAGYGYDSSNTYRHAFLWNNGSMTDLGTPSGASETLGFGVNNSGEVVGQTNDGRAFLYSNGTMQALSPSDGITPETAYGINTSGEVVGYAFVPNSGYGHGFLWTNGTYTDLGTLGGAYSEARAINDAGQIVGQARLANGDDHPFLWQNGTMTDLGALDSSFSNGEAFALNNASNPEVVGESSYQGVQHAFVWQNGVMTDLNNVLVNGSAWQSLDVAYGVNDTGQIVGDGHLLDGSEHGFLLTPVTAPLPDLHPSALSFGTQRVGTASLTSTVSLANTGNADLLIGGIALTGTNPGDFAQTNTCGSDLAPGTSCLISVTFTPTATGDRAAALTVSDNGSGGSQSVPLSGTGIAPAVTLSPNSLSFGSQNVGTTGASQTVTITNTGTDTLTFTSPSVSITGPNPGDFSESTTCGASLAPNATCTAAVTFTPTATGARSASLTVTDDAADSPQSVSVSGTGTAPAVSLSPASLTFAGQSVGTTSPAQTVTLTNTGTGPLTMSGIALDGTNAGDFAQTTTCGNSVAAGSTCTISVRFSPSASGSRDATLSILDNAATSPQTVDLMGSGLTADVGLAMSANTNVAKVGKFVTYTLTVDDNAGPGNATGVTIADTLPANTTVSSASTSCGSPAAGTVTCSLGTVAAGSSSSVTITVKVATYSAAVTNSATVTTTTTDPNTANNAASVTIQGKR